MIFAISLDGQIVHSRSLTHFTPDLREMTKIEMSDWCTTKDDSPCTCAHIERHG
jgi:hypothetical protein